MMKTIYLANPYGFSAQQKTLLLPPVVAALEELGLEVWEPFARNNQVDFLEAGWAYRIGQRDFRDVVESDAIFAVVNGVPPEEGMSIGHTFQDEVVIPSRLPKVSLKGLYQELSPEEYHRLHKLGLYYWAKDHGLCGGCGREPPRENRVLCERCAKQSGEIKKRSSAKRYQEALEQGLCTVCKNEPHRPNRRQCEACSDKNSKKQQIRRAKQKASRESSKTTESLQIHLALTGTQSD